MEKLPQYLANGTIWIDRGWYMGRESNESLLRMLGRVGCEKTVERYLRNAKNKLITPAT